MSSGNTLPEVLAARSAEITSVVCDAIVSYPTASLIWSGTEPGHGEAVQSIWERVLDLVRQGRMYSDDDLLFYQSVGVDFARRALPLSGLMAAFDAGVTAATRQFWRIAPDAPFAEMAHFTGWVIRITEQARQTCISAYLDTSQVGLGFPSSFLAEALIEGETAVLTTPAAEARLASNYLVLVCTTLELVATEPLRWTEIRRDIESIPGALHCGDLSRLVVLLPVRGTPGPAEALAAQLVVKLGSLAGRTLRAGQAYRPGLDGIPAAFDEACRVLPLVSAIPDADCRPYRMDELLVELAILRQPDIGLRLAALLLPLDAGPDLRRTIEVLLAHNLDRARAAKELCIHRRTLRYRMDRIRNLSGIDPDSAHGIQMLRAAVIATGLTAPGLPTQRPAPVTSPHSHHWPV